MPLQIRNRAARKIDFHIVRQNFGSFGRESKKYLILFRQENRAQRLTFGLRRPPGRVGVFHAKAWWPKSSCPPSKVCLPWRKSGMSQEFCQDVPDPWRCSKSLCKKVHAHFSFPNSRFPFFGRKLGALALETSTQGGKPAVKHSN